MTPVRRLGIKHRHLQDKSALPWTLGRVIHLLGAHERDGEAAE
jgi:hypothetical protein